MGIYDRAEREELVIETNAGCFTFHGSKEELKLKLSQEKAHTRIISAQYYKYSKISGFYVRVASEKW